ncbi:MAG: hypothetical protein MUE55_07610, partial [Thermoplasmata archaeon]|nr:hypothetical protein [Thermoplasmata archaeon]
TKVTAVGDQVGVEYEFLVEGKTHKGSRGGGMFATREKLGALVGNDIMLLVDPQKPKVHVMLSKLEQVIRRYA